MFIFIFKRISSSSSNKSQLPRQVADTIAKQQQEEGKNELTMLTPKSSSEKFEKLQQETA